MVDINVGYLIPLTELLLDKIRVDLTKTVNEFKDLIAVKLKRQKSDFDVCFAGNILKDTVTLVDAGIRENGIVHIMEKSIDETKTVPPFPESDYEGLLSVFRMLRNRHIIKRIFQKLSNPETLEKILEGSPGLKDNVVAMSIFQQPELLSRMGGSMEAVIRIAQTQPSLAYGVRNLMSLLTDDSFTTNFQHSLPQFSLNSSGSSDHSTDVFTDDDDDVDDEMDSQSEVSSWRSTRSLSSSDANVVDRIVNAVSPSTSSQPRSLASSRDPLSSPNPITTEMLTQAVQQAIQSSVSANQGSATLPVPTVPSSVSPPQNSRFQSSMPQLRSLGFTNETHNFQALELANGNVEDAINILLSGALDD